MRSESKCPRKSRWNLLEARNLRAASGENRGSPFARLLSAVLLLAAGVRPVVAGPVDQDAPAGAPAEQTVAEVVDRIDGAIVHIVTLDALDNKTGEASGFVIDQSGSVATSYHVLANAVKAYIQFHDGRKFDIAGVRGFSSKHDLAILQIKAPPQQLEWLALQNPGELCRGEDLIVIGHPSGFKFTVTTGILSAVRKTSEMPEEFQQWLRAAPDTVWIQTSAAASNGSSGAPLLTRHGNVVGVHSWIAREHNLGFAVHVRHLIQLRKKLGDAVQSLPLPGFGLVTDRRVAAFMSGFKRDYAVLLQRMQQAESKEEAMTIMIEGHPAGDCAEQLLELAQGDRDKSTAFDALLAVCQIAQDESGKSSQALAKATRLLGDEHLTDERMGDVASILATLPRDEVFLLLRKVIQENPHRDVKAIACFSLAQALARYDRGPQRFGPEIVNLLQEVVDEFSDVQYGQWSPDEETKKALFAFRHLCVGRPAPDIVGKGLDGVPFRLSEYRGKVTVIDFWADWCPFCRKMYPHERRLVDRFKDQPFALLGVNCDERPTLQRLVDQKVVTWRNWHDGPEGEIARKWNVTSYPTVFVLDTRGVIRYQGLRGEQLESAVEMLLGEALLKLPRDVVPLGSRWRYLDDASDQRSAWRKAEFDDSRWPVGTAPLGYGWGDEATKLRSTRARTIYFRGRFDLPNPTNVKDLLLEVFGDDGVAVYLNDTEIARTNLKEGAAYDQPAACACSRHGRTAWCFNVDPANLVRGVNVIAAEVHQESLGGVDLRFDLALSANVVPMLRTEIKKQDSPLRRKAVALLGSMGPADAAVPEIEEVVKQGDIDLQARALMALIRLQPEKSHTWTLPRPGNAQQQELRAALAMSLFHHAWEVVKKPGFSRNDYREVVAGARTASVLVPSLPGYSLIKSWGEYRSGQFQQAETTLQRFFTWNVHPAELVCKAMTQHALGKKETARKTMKRVHNLMKQPQNAWDLDTWQLIREAEASIALPQESEPKP